MSAWAGRFFLEQIKKKPDSVFGLATGSTPVGLYQKLTEAYKLKEADFSQIASFNLDEYYPIAPDDPQSYHYFMYRQLFAQVNMKAKNIHLIDGQTKNPEKFCAAYEKAIVRAGGIDFQLLGLGQNGHLGFNEPGSAFDSRTRVVDLSPATRAANARFFKNRKAVPRQAITMGLATIMEGRKLVILASGRVKAKAVAQAIEGPATEEIPASILQKHNDVTWILDLDAAGELKGIMK